MTTKRKHAYIGKLESNAVDAFDKVMGHSKYVGDMSFPGMLFAKLLISPIPHGKIIHLNVAPALDADGVHAVLTSDDFKDNGSFGWPVKDAYVLAYKKVRYVGDPIAVVAAETPEAADAAIRAIEIELEELPVVSDPLNALDPNAPLIPLAAPMDQGNLCEKHIVRYGDPDKSFLESERRIDRTYSFAHQEHACIETEGVLAIPQEDGSVTIFANDQSPHINRDNAAGLLELESEFVRIIQPPVGGSFGGKDDHVYQLTAQAGKLALITGHPAKLILSR